MGLDLELQIVILYALKQYYSADSFVDKDFIKSITCIPSQDFEQNLAYLVDKNYVQHPSKQTLLYCLQIRITADGIDFMETHKNIQARVCHLWELKKWAINPLMDNIQELVISQSDPFYGSFTKGVVYFGQDPMRRMLGSIDQMLYEDLFNHFFTLVEHRAHLQEAFGNFTLRRDDLVESLKSDISFLSDERKQDVIPLAIERLFLPEGLGLELSPQLESVLPHISSSTKEKCTQVKVYAQICEKKLKDFWLALSKLFFAYKLEGSCSFLKPIDFAEEKVMAEEKAKVEEFLKTKQPLIDELANRFQTHWNRPSSDKIKEWLEQFGSQRNMELALKLLQNILYLDYGKIQDIFREFYDGLDAHTRNRAVFTIFGSLDESASIVISICSKALTESERKKVWFQPLRDVIKSRKPDETVVIFVDDYLGSGTQAVDYLLEYLGQKQEREYVKVPWDDKEIQWLRQTRLIYFTLIGMDQGGQRLKEVASQYGLNLQVYSPIEVQKQYGCFNPSGLFDNRTEREQARDLVFKIGYQLFSNKTDWNEQKRRERALGYGNLQRLIIFSYNPPTSTLPIFWKEGVYDGKPWKPLFPRLA